MRFAGTGEAARIAVRRWLDKKQSLSRSAGNWVSGAPVRDAAAPTAVRLSD